MILSRNSIGATGVLYLYLFHSKQATAQLQVALRLIITGYFKIRLTDVKLQVHIFRF